MKRERLTTDNPKSNREKLMNYAYEKGYGVRLSYTNSEEGVALGEYLSTMAHDMGCYHSSEDILGGACSRCSCEVAVMNAVAIQAAELRTRLKEYEDTEEQSLLLRLPCRLGTAVYDISGGYVRKLIVDGFRVTDLGILVNLSESTKFYFSGWVVLNIGKTMFFTRQEAERALEDIQK